MEELKITNKHERDSRIVFDEEPHIYYIDKVAYDISVTGFIHKFFSEFNPKEIIDKYYDKWQLDQSSKYKGMSKEDIEKSWTDNGKLQSELGTKMHLDIENFYNGKEIDNDSIEFEFFLQYFRKHIYLEAYRTEWEVFDEKLKLAGSIDMLYKNTKTNKYVICDWKRSKEIKMRNNFQKGSSPVSHLDDCNFNHYSLQLNVYKRLLKINYDIDVEEMFLVRCHPNASDYEKIIVSNMDKEVDLLFTFREMQLNKEIDFKFDCI